MIPTPLLVVRHLRVRLELLWAQASRRMWTTLGEGPLLAALDTLVELDDPLGLAAAEDLPAQAVEDPLAQAVEDPLAQAVAGDLRVQGVARVAPAAQVADGEKRRQQHRR